MKSVTLGRTGLKVSEVCLGTMTFSREADEKTSYAIADYYVEQGGYFLDTATTEAGIQEWQTLSFVDEPKQPAFYRVEIHTIVKSKVYRFVLWRDFTTTQVLSNPIWVGRDVSHP